MIISALTQDEIEFGYIDSPHQRFPVVLDSPRDGQLQEFPYEVLLVRLIVQASALIPLPLLYINPQGPKHCLYFVFFFPLNCF